MRDYIEILLEDLSERRGEYLNGEYFAQQKTALQTSEILMDSCTDDQKKLFLAYEQTQNAADSISELALARQAFLLAKEIFS